MKWHVATYKLENFFHLFPSISFRIRFHCKFHVDMIRIGVMAETLYFAFPIPCVIRSELNFVLYTENGIQRYWMTGEFSLSSFAFYKVLRTISWCDGDLSTAFSFASTFLFRVTCRIINGLHHLCDSDIDIYSSYERIFICTCKTTRQWKRWIMSGSVELHERTNVNIKMCENYDGKFFVLRKVL